MGSQADDIAAALTKQVETAAKALTLEIAANLIEATPVDTGWARANWIPSIGEPVTEPDGTAPKKDHGAVVGSVSNAAQQQGQAAILRFTLDDVDLFITNNVPYIGMLNYGSSKQAPAGFVEVAIDKALQTLQQRYAGTAINIGGLRGAFDQEGGAIGAGNLAEAFSPFGGEA